jgi:uncharacterized protein YciI
MKHFLLIYDLAADYLERRGAFREAHLAAAWRACERGELLLGGALAAPPDRAYLLFCSPDAGSAEAFAREDPYVRNGVVTAWSVREWTTVVGAAASTPVRPERPGP